MIFFLLVVNKDGVYVLDMAAKIDATADYLCKAKWGDVEFPPPFGREAYPEVNGPINILHIKTHVVLYIYNTEIVLLMHPRCLFSYFL